jgi:hypothetical protein
MLPSPSARLADPVWETQLRRLPAEGPEAVINECIDELRLEVDNRTAADAGDRCDAHGWVPSARGRRIWDMFIVDREIDLVEARIAELFPYVDFFVIAEANQTHQGHAKASHVRGAWRTRLARFASKVVHVWVEPPFYCPVFPWACENYQRERLLDGFLRAGGRADDVVLVSDVDEVPRASVVRLIGACDFERDVRRRPTLLRLHGDHFWYSAHCRRSDRQWKLGPVAASGRALLRFGAHQLRRSYSQRGADALNDNGAQTGARLWAQLDEQLRRAGADADAIGAAKKAFGRGKLTSRPFMPRWYRPPLELLEADMVVQQVLPNASWHYSYLMSPEAIVYKYHSALVAHRGFAWEDAAWHLKAPDWHFRMAMRCASPQHPKWKWEYVANLTEREVPRFVLRNRCRMRMFFAYARRAAVAGTANDYWLQPGALCSVGGSLRAGDVCCPASCGACGGRGCSGRPGGRTKCCVPAIQKSGRACTSPEDTACVILE